MILAVRREHAVKPRQIGSGRRHQRGSNGYLGFNEWRLPTVTDLGNDGCSFAYTGTDCGYNVNLATSEMADVSGARK